MPPKGKKVKSGKSNANQILSGGFLRFVVKNCDSSENFQSVFVTEEEKVYTISLDFLVHLVCPYGSGLVELLSVSTSEVLASETVVSGVAGTLTFESLLTAGFQFRFRFTSTLAVASAEFEATVEINEQQSEALALLRKATAFDKNLEVQWIPARPTQEPSPWQNPAYPDRPGFPAPPLPEQNPDPTSTYAWFSAILPHKRNQLPVPLVPNADGHGKFQSVNYSVFVYLGLDMFDESLRKSDEMTIFIKDFQDRGSGNRLKKQYMAAVACHVLPYYAEKIRDFVNVLVTEFDVQGKAVLSSFKEELVNFFLRVHVGDDDYPENVRLYFKRFLDIIGFGDPDLPAGPNRPSRDQTMLFGYNTVTEVKEYFDQRVTAIRASQDESTMIYWWDKAGLPAKSLVIEGVHNILAFSQFENTFLRLVNDAVWALADANGQVPANAPPSPIPVNRLRAIASQFGIPLAAVPGHVNFFAKMNAATNAEERLDVVREAYRLLSPNTNDFSKGLDANGTDGIQTRHVRQSLMILNELPAIDPQNPTDQVNQLQRTFRYFTYDPSRYASFQTDLTQCTVPAGAKPSTFLEPRSVEKLFSTSTVDGQTVVEKANDKVLPVLTRPNPALGPLANLANPTYLPFGSGYRRCAGEPFVYQVTEALIRKFAEGDLYKKFFFEPFVADPADPFAGFVTLGPFTAVPDTLFLEQPSP